jgi:hypothetical protein
MWKAQTGGNADVINYYNFFLVEKQLKGTRKAFTLMDAFGSLGGANRSFGMIIGFLLIPFKYNITASKIYSGLLMNYEYERS